MNKPEANGPPRPNTIHEGHPTAEWEGNPVQTGRRRVRVYSMGDMNECGYLTAQNVPNIQPNRTISADNVYEQANSDTEACAEIDNDNDFIPHGLPPTAMTDIYTPDSTSSGSITYANANNYTSGSVTSSDTVDYMNKQEFEQHQAQDSSDGSVSFQQSRFASQDTLRKHRLGNELEVAIPPAYSRMRAGSSGNIYESIENGLHTVHDEEADEEETRPKSVYQPLGMTETTDHNQSDPNNTSLQISLHSDLRETYDDTVNMLPSTPDESQPGDYSYAVTPHNNYRCSDPTPELHFNTVYEASSTEVLNKERTDSVEQRHSGAGQRVSFQLEPIGGVKLPIVRSDEIRKENLRNIARLKSPPPQLPSSSDKEMTFPKQTQSLEDREQPTGQSYGHIRRDLHINPKFPNQQEVTTSDSDNVVKVRSGKQRKAPQKQRHTLTRNSDPTYPETQSDDYNDHDPILLPIHQSKEPNRQSRDSARHSQDFARNSEESGRRRSQEPLRDSGVTDLTGSQFSRNRSSSGTSFFNGRLRMIFYVFL